MLTEFLVENKCTEHKSISLKHSWLEKIAREAREEGKAPALAIQFVDKQGNSLRHARWVLVEEHEFKELIDA